MFAADTASAEFRLKDNQDVKDVIINMLTRLGERLEQLNGQPSLLSTVLEDPAQHNDKSESSEFSDSLVSSFSYLELS